MSKAALENANWVTREQFNAFISKVMDEAGMEFGIEQVYEDDEGEIVLSNALYRDWNGFVRAAWNQHGFFVDSEWDWTADAAREDATSFS